MSLFFPKSDEQFKDWIIEFGVGFFINTRRSIDSKYMVLHGKNCKDFRQPEEDGAYTQNEYTKICARTIEELSEWVALNGRPDKTFSKECQHCNPRSYTQISEQSAKEHLWNHLKENEGKYDRRKLRPLTINILKEIQLGNLPSDAIASVINDSN